MSDANIISGAIAEAAEAWSDPEYPLRIEAVTRALEASNKFTQEAVAFAVNQHMSQLQLSKLNRWLQEKLAASPQKVMLFHHGRVPLEELRAWVGIVASGHWHIGVYEEEPPYLLCAFIEDVRGRYQALKSTCTDLAEELPSLDAVIAMGVDDAEALLAYFDDRELKKHKGHLIRQKRQGVCILDGKESANDMERLAEDVLLHEGVAEENVSVIWAPAELNPDPYLEAFALFRSIFPAHERTAGSLQMQKAFLAAQNAAHAYGDGLEFLVSKGDPAFQEPGHIRWVPYANKNEVESWVDANKHVVQHVTARTGLQGMLSFAAPVLSFGESHRSTLETDRTSNDVLDFLN